MNPFNDHLDWTFQGKYCRVYSQNRVYHGWVDLLHHNRGSVILHDAEDVTRDVLAGDTTETTGTRQVGSVFIRVCEHIEELDTKRSKTIEDIPVAHVEDSPYLDRRGTPKDYHMRRAYRNGFAGSYPVVRPIHNDNGSFSHYELLNGHKRVEAMRRVGLETHPFEVFPCSDAVAEELVALAHREEMGKDGADTTDEAVCSDCGETHDDGACWDDAEFEEVNDDDSDG